MATFAQELRNNLGQYIPEIQKASDEEIESEADQIISSGGIPGVNSKEELINHMPEVVKQFQSGEAFRIGAAVKTAQKNPSFVEQYGMANRQNVGQMGIQDFARDAASVQSPSMTAKDMFEQQDLSRKTKIGEFDTSRKMAEGEENYSEEKSKLDKQKDPNSAESKMAQLLASKYDPSGDYASKSAMELAGILPGLEKVLGIKTASEDRALAREAQADAREQSRLDRAAILKDKADEKAELPDKEQHKADVKLLGEDDLGGSISSQTSLLEKVKQLPELHKGMATTGVIGGHLPNVTNAAISYNRIATDLRLKQSALKGSGAVSDFERKLAAATIPGDNERESTAIPALNALIADLEAAQKKDIAKYDAAAARHRKLGLDVQSVEDITDRTYKNKPGANIAFPVTMTKGGKQVTVNNESEMKEASDEGWK